MLPVALGLLLLSPRTRRRLGGRGCWLFGSGRRAGAGTPQWLINKRHFGASTPLVLAQSKDAGHPQPLPAKAEMVWPACTKNTSRRWAASCPPASSCFWMPPGAAVLQSRTGGRISEIDSPGHYLRLRGPAPAGTGRSVCPSPVRRPRHQPPHALPEALGSQLAHDAAAGQLRAVVLGGAGGAGRHRPTVPRGCWCSRPCCCPAWPCIPLSMEVRFLLPLHLLAAGAGGVRPLAGLGVGGAAASWWLLAAVSRFMLAGCVSAIEHRYQATTLSLVSDPTYLQLECRVRGEPCRVLLRANTTP